MLVEVYAISSALSVNQTHIVVTGDQFISKA